MVKYFSVINVMIVCFGYFIVLSTQIEREERWGDECMKILFRIAVIPCKAPSSDDSMTTVYKPSFGSDRYR